MIKVTRQNQALSGVHLMHNNKIPRCSLPGGQIDCIQAPSKCSLGRWLETNHLGRPWQDHDLQELRQIHSQLHWIAQEILWYNNVNDSSIGIHAMEHFNDLWQQLSNKTREINKKV